MKIRFSPRFPMMIQTVAVIGFMLAMILGGTNVRIIALTVRQMFVVVVVGASVLIILALRGKSRLLLSGMDVGWIALIVLTGITVVLAAFPRRSLEIWLLTYGLQFPLAYAILYLLRRRWPPRAVYRAMLLVGGYFYILAVISVIPFLALAFSARANGLPAPTFRLWGVLDNPSVLAMFIAVAVPCVVGHALMGVRRLERALIILWLVGAAITTLANATRSGAIALFISVAVTVYLGLLAHPKRPLRRFQDWAATHRTQATRFTVAAVVGVIAVITVVLVIQSNAPDHADGSDRVELYRTALLSFAQHPLNGLGTGGFVLAEESTHSIPPFLLVPHAHNLFLNMAADGGLIGLAGLLIFLIVAVRVSVIAWRTQPERRPLLAGAIGGLIGFFAGGFFELPINQPGLFVLATALIMIIAAGTPPPQRVAKWRVGLILVLVLVISIVSVILLITYTQFWNLTYADSPTLSDDTALIQSKATQLTGLVNADPADPLIRLQAAYTWAHLGDTLDLSGRDSRVAFSEAADQLQQAIQYDPYFGLHYLNLSVLYAKLGYDPLAAAYKATVFSRQDPVVWLNVGIINEKAGSSTNAESAYLAALKLEPDWRFAEFWDVSAVRQSALTAFKQLDLAPVDRFDDLLLAGDTARQSGDREAAIRAYQTALDLNIEAGRNMLAQGLLAWTQGDLSKAQFWFKQVDSPSSWLYRGTMARDRGNKAEMLDDYYQLYQAISARGGEGVMTAHSDSYATNSFWRFGVVSDYVDGVTRLDVPLSDADALKTLADSMAAQGDGIGAAKVINAIRMSNPRYEDEIF